MENRFHLLLDSDGEENAHRITSSPPPPVVLENPITVRHAPMTKFISVLQRVGQETSRSKMAILHGLRASVSKGFRVHVCQARAAERRALIHSCLTERDNFNGHPSAYV